MRVCENEKFKINITEFIDDVLSERDKEELFRHAEICEDCKQEIEMFMKLKNVFDDIEQLEVPNGLHEEWFSVLHEQIEKIGKTETKETPVNNVINFKRENYVYGYREDAEEIKENGIKENEIMPVKLKDEKNKQNGQNGQNGIKQTKKEEKSKVLWFNSPVFKVGASAAALLFCVVGISMLSKVDRLGDSSSAAPQSPQLYKEEMMSLDESVDADISAETIEERTSGEASPRDEANENRTLFGVGGSASEITEPRTNPSEPARPTTNNQNNSNNQNNLEEPRATTNPDSTRSETQNNYTSETTVNNPSVINNIPPSNVVADNTETEVDTADTSESTSKQESEIAESTADITSEYEGAANDGATAGSSVSEISSQPTLWHTSIDFGQIYSAAIAKQFSENGIEASNIIMSGAGAEIAFSCSVQSEDYEKAKSVLENSGFVVESSGSTDGMINIKIFPPS